MFVNGSNEIEIVGEDLESGDDVVDRVVALAIPEGKSISRGMKLKLESSQKEKSDE